MTEIKRIVENTAAAPVEIRLAAVMFGGPNPIERQEARGQQQLVESSQIPTKGTKRPEEIEHFTKLGIELGPETPGDPLFRSAKLPAGWTKVADRHAMWSAIVDEKGRKRFMIFYKAAFYDRRANVNPYTHRYEYVFKVGDTYFRSCNYNRTGGIPGRTMTFTSDQRQANRFRARSEIAREFGPEGDYGPQAPVEIPADAKFVRVVHDEDPLYVELIGEPEKADAEEKYVPYPGE